MEATDFLATILENYGPRLSTALLNRANAEGMAKIDPELLHDLRIAPQRIGREILDQFEMLYGFHADVDALCIALGCRELAQKVVSLPTNQGSPPIHIMQFRQQMEALLAKLSQGTDGDPSGEDF